MPSNVIQKLYSCQKKLLTVFSKVSLGKVYTRKFIVKKSLGSFGMN